MSDDDTIICPFCGKVVGDEVCEHTVFFAMNECGLIHLAEPYRDQFMAVAEKLMRATGELEDDESLGEDDCFPTHIIPEMMGELQIGGLEYRDVYGVPPSGLAIYAAFADVP